MTLGVSTDDGDSVVLKDFLLLLQTTVSDWGCWVEFPGIVQGRQESLPFPPLGAKRKRPSSLTVPLAYIGSYCTLHYFIVLYTSPGPECWPRSTSAGCDVNIDLRPCPTSVARACCCCIPTIPFTRGSQSSSRGCGEKRCWVTRQYLRYLSLT